MAWNLCQDMGGQPGYPTAKHYFYISIRRNSPRFLAAKGLKAPSIRWLMGENLRAMQRLYVPHLLLRDLSCFYYSGTNLPLGVVMHII